MDQRWGNDQILHDIFLKDFKKNGLKFNFMSDGHWNERAHFLVADTLFKNISSKIKYNQ